MTTKPGKLPPEVILSGCGYRVTAHEGMVIFEETGGMWGHHTRIMFERSGLPGGGCWYVSYDSTYGRMLADHICLAYEVVKAVYGDNWHELQVL